MDNMAKVLLATGMIVAYSYFIEGFMAWYGGNPYEAIRSSGAAVRRLSVLLVRAHRVQHPGPAVALVGAVAGASWGSG
jgi:hypothetical protein